MSTNREENKIKDLKNKRILLAFVLAVVIVVVTAVVLVNTVLASSHYRRVEFVAPPTSIPGTSFGWNVCTQNANSTVTCITENEHAPSQTAQLPPIVIGNGEDVNQTSSAAPAKQPSPSSQPPIVVFGG